MKLTPTLPRQVGDKRRAQSNAHLLPALVPEAANFVYPGKTLILDHLPSSDSDSDGEIQKSENAPFSDGPQLPLEVLTFSGTLGGMIGITTVLAAEHKMFCGLFDSIEKRLPKIKTVAEARHLARLVEGLLRRHARAEEDLWLQAHAAGSGDLQRDRRLHQEHHEIDVRLNRSDAGPGQ